MQFLDPRPDLDNANVGIIREKESIDMRWMVSVLFYLAKHIKISLVSSKEETRC